MSGSIEFAFEWFLRNNCAAGGLCQRWSQITAAHEFGHVLAFSGPYGVGGVGHTGRTDSIMQNRSADALPLAPTSTDINTLLTAYGCP
jgi:hypothetical protein